MHNSPNTRPDSTAGTAQQLFVNGQARSFAPGLTIQALLEQRGDAPQAVATALNGQFVPRHQREGTVLRAGDSLTIFEAITGG